MSIAEKLVRIAEREQFVYDAGYWNGKSVGRQDEYNRFWDGVFSGAGWQGRFYGASWNDTTFYPDRDLKPTSSANDIFTNCNITDLVGRLKECGVTLDTSGITVRSDYMFSYAIYLTTVPFLDLRNVRGTTPIMNNMFTNCYKLKTIEGIRVADEGDQALGSGIFTQCKELESVTFYGTIGSANLDLQWSTKLNRASIESIINALSTTASGLTVRFSRTAVNNAFDGGSTGDEWLNLIATKSNWTITLV